MVILLLFVIVSKLFVVIFNRNLGLLFNFIFFLWLSGVIFAIFNILTFDFRCKRLRTSTLGFKAVIIMLCSYFVFYTKKMD